MVPLPVAFGLKDVVENNTFSFGGGEFLNGDQRKSFKMPTGLRYYTKSTSNCRKKIGKLEFIKNKILLYFKRLYQESEDTTHRVRENMYLQTI